MQILVITLNINGLILKLNNNVEVNLVIDYFHDSQLK